MGYNILLDSHIGSTTSGIFGLANTSLSYNQVEDLVFGRNIITVTSGHYIGIDTQFGMDMVCYQARLYSSQVASGIVQFHYKEFLENRWYSNGEYNYNTDYSTPRMSSNFDPEPYSCSGTSTWDPVWYAAYKAFNQTANDSLDCWYSTTGSGGSPPQSIMFYFPYGKAINKYSLQSRNHTSSRCFPKAFYLQGNAVETPSLINDTHWETLDYRQSISDPGQAEWSSYFTFENAKAYTYYRLKVTESNGSQVSIANIKLVESNRAESVPLYTWYNRTMGWDGSSYVYNLPASTGIEEAKFFLGTSSDTITVSGVELLVSSAEVLVSGVVASGIYVDNYLLTHRTLDPFILNLQNLMVGNAKPYMLFKYTGVFEIDRNLFISPNYVQDKNGASWYGLDNGYTTPEIDDFESGIFLGTETLGREVILAETEISGQWRSPVIDTENKAASAYAYVAGNADVYVRASETPPPLVNFLIVTTDTSHRWLMYDHKRMYIDSMGRTIGGSECNAPEDGSKIWRVADEEWAGTDLMYYGTINSHGTAAFLAPGCLECGDMSPEQEWNSPEHWYNMGVCTLDDDSQWGVGTTVSGLPYGQTVSVLFTKLFPVKDSDGFFCFTITYDSSKQVSSLNLSFQQDGFTRGSYPLFTMNGSITPGSNVDVAYDEANGGWWVYMGLELYKVDAGSINNVRIFSSTPGPDSTDTLRGYIWKTLIDRTWKSLVSIPSQDYSYFWAFNDTTIYLYEEKYELGQPSIIEHAEITTGVQVEAGFTGFNCGSCDSYGNLWVLDLLQERLVRISLQKALDGDPRAVDYENQIAGIIGVWAHPTDGTCFVLISDEPEHPEQDIIRMVHANQRWGSRGKYVCSVPGFYSKPYEGGVFFTGNSFSGRIRPHETDTVWGTSGGAEWVKYEGKGRSLPRGRYKQIRVDLSRSDISIASPRLQRVRMPKPIPMAPLSYRQELGIAIKSTLNKVKTPGDWDAKLQVWWFDEEI
jgi:hypothetical protein